MNVPHPGSRFVPDPRLPVRPGRGSRSVWNARLLAAVSAAGVAVASNLVPVDGGGVQIAAGLTVDRRRDEVRLVARVACDRGFLEQLVCLEGTREHESLLSTAVAPSAVHAGLLMLGLEPGHPGRWSMTDDGGVSILKPEGPHIEALVRRIRGATVAETPLRDWVAGPDGSAFTAPLVFAGSEIRPNPPSLARIRGPGEHYVADLTGSLIGLVTFGDEVIAPTSVQPDRTDVSAPIHSARSGVVPGAGSVVTLILRPVAPTVRSVP